MLIGIDFESRSRRDIEETGATQYARDPSTEPMFLGYAGRMDGENGHASIWRQGEPFPPALAHAAANPEAVFCAHNSQFDRVMWRVHFTEKMGLPFPKRWICSAVRASANGLPRGLDDACGALGLPGKDKEGGKALKKLYAPNKKTGRFIMPADDPALYAAAENYCRTDIHRMFQLLQRTKPLSLEDQLYYEWDQRLNENGMPVDADGVDRLLEVLALAQEDVEARGFAYPPLTAVKQIGDYCERYGVVLPNMQAQTLVDALDRDDLPDNVRELLQLRQLAGLASIKKLAAFKQRGMEEVIDGKRFYIIRDSYVMNKAHTGRHAAQGAQTQNLKRECATEAEVDLLMGGDLELVKMLAGEPLPLLGKSIRPMVTARRGKLLIGDFGKIETCLTFWFAGHREGLDALNAGRDLYKELATLIFNKAVEAIKSEERQLGKQGILGCGFGAGATTVQATCAKYGIKISLAMAEKIVAAYRSMHYPVTVFWRRLEDCIKKAILGQPMKLGLLKFAADKEQLAITLPSGRKLRYREPSVRDNRIRFWHQDPKTFQWVEKTEWGGGFTNNVVQATANCLQRVATLELERRGFDMICMTSHDEIVAEDDENRLDEFLDTMALKDCRPSWAAGIPITVEGKATKRYRK